VKAKRPRAQHTAHFAKERSRIATPPAGMQIARAMSTLASVKGNLSNIAHTRSKRRKSLFAWRASCSMPGRDIKRDHLRTSVAPFQFAVCGPLCRHQIDDDVRRQVEKLQSLQELRHPRGPAEPRIFRTRRHARSKDLRTAGIVERVGSCERPPGPRLSGDRERSSRLFRPLLPAGASAAGGFDQWRRPRIRCAPRERDPQRALPAGTVGGRMATTQKPASHSNFCALKAASGVPRMTAGSACPTC